MAVHGGGTAGSHGGEPFGPAYYRYANGEMRSGMLVCSFQLEGIAPGDGGFVSAAVHYPTSACLLAFDLCTGAGMCARLT